MMNEGSMVFLLAGNAKEAHSILDHDFDIPGLTVHSAANLLI